MISWAYPSLSWDESGPSKGGICFPSIGESSYLKNLFPRMGLGGYEFPIQLISPNNRKAKKSFSPIAFLLLLWSTLHGLAQEFFLAEATNRLASLCAWVGICAWTIDRAYHGETEGKGYLCIETVCWPRCRAIAIAHGRLQMFGLVLTFGQNRFQTQNPVHWVLGWAALLPRVHPLF